MYLKTFRYCSPILVILLWVGLIGVLVSVEEELEWEVHPTIIYLIPIIGLSLWMGLISGYIPSILYDDNEKWPRQYAIFQVAIFALTYLRLEQKNTNEEEELYLEDFTEASHFLGTTFHKIFYQDGGFKLALESFGWCFVYYMLAMISFLFINDSHSTKANKDRKQPSLGFIVLRNFVLLVVLTGLSCLEDLENGDFGVYCEKFNPEGDFIAPFSVKKMNQNFATAWRRFHLPDLWLVRLSHSMLYPTIILLLTQRSIGRFLIWFMFIEIDFFHVLADTIHYVEGPELAWTRLEYQGGSDECYLNGYLMHTLLAYPLNFVYLVAPWGDRIQ